MNPERLLNITLQESIEDVWPLLCEYMDTFGFDRLIYGATRFKSKSSLGAMEDALILSNHPKAYTDRFFGEEHYKHAPMMVWCMRNKGACSWSWAEDRRQAGLLDDKELKVLESNREFDVIAGYTVCFQTSSDRSFAGFSLAARPGLSQADVDRIWTANSRELELVTMVAHLKIASLPQCNNPNRLTMRQREVLEWAADGKTVADIARLIDRKAATVEKHLRLAREALNAETTAQAVLKASVQNQIFRV